MIYTPVFYLRYALRPAVLVRLSVNLTRENETLLYGRMISAPTAGSFVGAAHKPQQSPTVSFVGDAASASRYVEDYPTCGPMRAPAPTKDVKVSSPPEPFPAHKR